MEIHQHSQAGRKKWTHYLWEFLMLFFAVFSGFLAENFREHQVEKEKGKQYIHSLYEDLIMDTTRLNFLIDLNNHKIESLKTMESCYDTLTKTLHSTSCLGELVRRSMVNGNFQMSDRTLKQLGNAGGYRLLNKDDADSIISYENSFKNFDNFQTTLFQQSQDNVRNTFNELIDFKTNIRIRGIPGESNPPGPINLDLKDLSNDPALQKRYFNQLFLYWRVTVTHRNILLSLKTKAIGLIAYYKRKYQLK